MPRQVKYTIGTQNINAKNSGIRVFTKISMILKLFAPKANLASVMQNCTPPTQSEYMINDRKFLLRNTFEKYPHKYPASI